MNNKVYINYEKLNKTIDVLSYIDDILSTTDLTTDFEDMESYFREINFEHANCIKYKESFDIIYNDFDVIRKRVNELKNSLVNTSVINKNNEKELSYEIKNNGKDFGSSLRRIKNTLLAELNNYNNTNTEDGNNVTTIPSPATTPQVEQKDTGYLDTLPIGVAIGTAGVVGSIGTVLFNEYYLANKNKPQKKMEFDQYNVSETFNNDDDYKSMVTNDYFKTPTMYGSGESSGHYSAARRNNTKNVVFSDEVESEVNLPDDPPEDDKNDDFSE